MTNGDPIWIPTPEELNADDQRQDDTTRGGRRVRRRGTMTVRSTSVVRGDGQEDDQR